MAARTRIRATIYNKRGRVISVGYNSYVKTHPLVKRLSEKVNINNKEYLHAEIAALIRCKSNPYKMLVERKGRDGRYRLAKPCPICMLAIKLAKVKILEYTTDTGVNEAIKLIGGYNDR